MRPVGLVLEHLWTWYRRNWRATVVSSVLMPLMFLGAMGFGLGSQIRPGPATAGLPYVVYLAPAMLVALAVQVATGESSFPVLGSFKWDQRYFAITSTPVTADQLLTAQAVWVALRVLVSGLAYMAVAALFGAFINVGALLAVPVSVLAGMAFGAWVLALAASVNDEGTTFGNVFRFVVVPMTLFAGTYYPISQLPAWSRPLAWVTPLWHGNELARAVEFGHMDVLTAAGHVGYLLLLTAGGLLLARRRFHVRLKV
ncbi:ABC transporter permease [Kutzneria kofuensis]|jgi:lipooligosaccharide transport system permease protein|uniref:Transport permease protein n=1 Tax=Kutzneria kofuensis TaxID=103725 RepID=A0A7W9NG46_9PSEU|nr:ABC transporter permease [Kutzneria kofuensis]MBB5890796.1 lipooligosaccharide transport system permease protein [Kutzneria kofuensis]